MTTINIGARAIANANILRMILDKVCAIGIFEVRKSTIKLLYQVAYVGAISFA